MNIRPPRVLTFVISSFLWLAIIVNNNLPFHMMSTHFLSRIDEFVFHQNFVQIYLRRGYGAQRFEVHNAYAIGTSISKRTGIGKGEIGHRAFGIVDGRLDRLGASNARFPLVPPCTHPPSSSSPARWALILAVVCFHPSSGTSFSRTTHPN